MPDYEYNAPFRRSDMYGQEPDNRSIFQRIMTPWQEDPVVQPSGRDINLNDPYSSRMAPIEEKPWYRKALDFAIDPTAPIRGALRSISPYGSDPSGRDMWLPSDLLGAMRLPTDPSEAVPGHLPPVEGLSEAAVPLFGRGRAAAAETRSIDVNAVPKIEDLLGKGWKKAGRTPEIELGASPKRTIITPSGERWMHKATPTGVGGRAATESEIARASTGYNMPQIVGEEAGSRTSRLINKKTPIARQVQEGGTVQPYVEGAPFREIWAGNVPGVSPNALDTEAVARQMQEELPVDTLIRNSDPNRGNFMYDKSTGLVIPVDKGLSYVQGFEHGPMTTMFQNPQNLAEDAFTYGRLEGRSGRRGVGAWNKYLDPNAGLGFIQKNIETIPEASFRETLTPLKRGGRMSDADFDDLIHNFMQETTQLRPRMADWYRMHKP